MASPPLSSEERALLEAAASLLKETGHDGFTMDRLAELTGLSRATLYRRLGSRESILQRLGEEGLIDAKLANQPDMRLRILQAARVVFVRSGLTEASIEEIAREAGVGSATIYRHFKDRDGLLVAFFEYMRPIGWLRELRLDPSDDVEADLLGLVRQIVRSLLANRDIMLLVLTERLRHSALIEKMNSTPERTQRILAEWIEARIRAGQLAEGDPFSMAGALVGMLLSLAVFGPTFYVGSEDPEQIARLIVRVFLDGLRAEGPRRL